MTLAGLDGRSSRGAAATARRVGGVALAALTGALAMQSVAPLRVAAQTGEQIAQPSLVVRRVAAGTGDVLALPASSTLESGDAIVDGIAFEVATAGGVRIYRATDEGRTYSARADAAGPAVRFAYERTSRRFAVITSTLRADLNAFDDLDRLVGEIGAVSGKAYPQLGFALIRLPREADPIAAVDRLAARHGIRASVQLQEVRRRPHAHGLRRTREQGRRRPFRDGRAQSRRQRVPPRSAKDELAADLLVFIQGIRLQSDQQIDVEIDVVNWGAAPAATTLSMTIADEPAFATPLTRAARQVPVVEPRGRYSAVIPVRLVDLPGAGVYFLEASITTPTTTELRQSNNDDLAGFRLDAGGRVQLECAEPGRGGAPGEDPLHPQQWHLHNTGQTAYADAGGVANEDLGMGDLLDGGPDGRGVKVAVVDTGLEICHPDLAARIETDASYNFNVGAVWPTAQTSDPFSPYTAGDHGTSIAGLIAAEADNGIGGRGVAPGVLLRGYNYLNVLDYDVGTFLDSLGASDYAPDSSDVDVFNLSFGSLGYPRNASQEEEAAFAWGVRRLRGGRGALYVKSAGNGFNKCRSLRVPLNDSIGCTSANGDDTNNLPYLMVVGGFNADGKRASYASAGANLWVSAPAGQYGRRAPALLTTDQFGRTKGYGAVRDDRLASRTEVNPDGDYTSGFNGTSSAAANVSGVVAVLLAAAPELTWRDVRHVLATTARRIDPSAERVTGSFGGVDRVVQERWIVNGAGFGYHNWYGFGAVDAARALAAAREHPPDSLGPFRRSGWFDASEGRLDIPDDAGDGVTSRLTVAGLPASANVEAVVVEVDLDHPFPHDVGVHLTSPSGTPSVVNPVFNEVLAIDRAGAPLRWRLLSNAFYGEAPNGAWRLTVFDGADGDSGALNGWRLRIYYGEHP